MDTPSAKFGEKPSVASAPDDAELLRVALHGSDEEWLHLYEECEKRQLAGALFHALSTIPEEHRQQADHWLAAISELHPGLISKGLPAYTETNAHFPQDRSSLGETLSALQNTRTSKSETSREPLSMCATI